jgi:hypothetical protein
VFVLSALAYPAVLAALCLGGGLAVDRLSGGWVPGVLLPAVGAGALIGVAEITTFVPGLAPATPYAVAVVGACGLAAGWRRLQLVGGHWRAHRWQLLLPALVFVIAAAPVLFAGRPTFAAYMVLTDSALHMIGADYLMRFGQHYAHLDLVNSYGQYINSYYNASYPTGADALLGSTASLAQVPVIWAFQPFNAFVLTLACGPAWLLARRMGLEGAWAAVAASAATLPALVYAYELIGSIKEITALPLTLTLGALVVTHPRWLRRGARGSIPFAIVVAAGVSALGPAFGAWTVGAVVVLCGVLIAEHSSARRHARALAALASSGIVVLVVFAWPTWRHVSGAVAVTQAVVTSADRGNLVSPLRAVQVFGAWLVGSYQSEPTGLGLILTDALIGVTAVAAVVGAVHLLRTRRFALTAWLAAMAILGLVVTRLGGTWSDAKTLVLSSSVFVLLAWGGVAAFLGGRGRPAALALALILAAGVLASDALQYHDTALAPTARYDELASIGNRFARRGPALFTDFDEYALYELRNVDVGGPDFLFPPVGLEGIDTGHGAEVVLDRIRAAALRAYPLIVTRRDPTTPRPPSAYRLAWQGDYYDVWARRPDAPAAIARFTTRGEHPVSCRALHSIARVAASRGGTLAAASPADVIEIDLARAHRPAGWGHSGVWYAIASPGTLRAVFTIGHAGVWEVWLKGEFMPTIGVGVDGRRIGSITGQVGGDEVVPDTTAPLLVRLRAGRHHLTVTRTATGLGPGANGWAFLAAVFLTPAGNGERQHLHVVAAADWRALCGHPYLWVEAVPRVSGHEVDA